MTIQQELLADINVQPYLVPGGGMAWRYSVKGVIAKDRGYPSRKAAFSVTRNVEVTKKHGTRIVTPKSKNSVRKFEINAGLVEMLRREKQMALALTGAPLIKLPQDALCFPALGTLTEIRCPAGVTGSFLKRARKLGCPASFHDLRASHETALLDRGVPVHVVAKRCGHDPATLLKAYARRTKKTAAAGAVGALMDGVLGTALGPVR
jgi:integrase